MELEPFDDDVVHVPLVKFIDLKKLEPLPVLDMVLEPFCRYGHGPLLAQANCYSMDHLRGSHTDDISGRLLVRGNGGFRVQLWRCPVCRYLEMFDPD